MSGDLVRRVGILLIIPVLAACSDASDPPGAAPSARDLTACTAVLSQPWQEAFATSGVDTGGSTSTLAVGPGGEVAAARDDAASRDLLIVSPEGSVTTVYSPPDPDRDRPGFAALDDRWIVVGVERFLRPSPDAPAGTNGALPTLTRIDVIDRRDRSVRTVVESSDADHLTGGPTLDSFALSDDAVFWITRDTYPSDEGVLRSFDLQTGTVARVEAGPMRDVRAIPDGIAYSRNSPVEHVFRPSRRLPDGVAAVVRPDDRWTLATDGEAYAWITGVTDGGTGVAWWSPDGGLVRLDTGRMARGDGAFRPTVWVDGRYVAFGAMLVDARSGAVADVDPVVVGMRGGTVALQLQAPGGKFAPSVAGMIRLDGLPTPAC